MSLTLFTSFLVTKGKLRSFFIETDFTGGRKILQIQTEELPADYTQDYLRDRTKAIFERRKEKVDPMGTVNKISGIVIDEPLLTAAVSGISIEGSMKLAEQLAWSLLLDVKKRMTSYDDFKPSDFDNIDFLVIAGGYDDAKSTRLDRMIGNIAVNLSATQNRPTIIFAGSKLSRECAVRELSHYAKNNDVIIRENVMDLESSYYQGDTKHDNSITQAEAKKSNIILKIPEILPKISELYCLRRRTSALSFVFNDDYSLISTVERGDVEPVFRNYAIAESIENIPEEHFESAYNGLFTKRQTIFDEDEGLHRVLPIVRKNARSDFLPDKVIGISLTKGVDLNKFISILTKIIHNQPTVEFIFDSTGFLTAVASIYICDRTTNSYIDVFSDNNELKSGWLITPEGKFDFGKPALTLEIVGEKKEDRTLKWGEIEYIEVAPHSVVEVYAEEKVFLDDEKSAETFHSKDAGKLFVFDLRNKGRNG